MPDTSPSTGISNSASTGGGIAVILGSIATIYVTVMAIYHKTMDLNSGVSVIIASLTTLYGILRLHVSASNKGPAAAPAGTPTVVVIPAQAPPAAVPTAAVEGK